MTAWLMFVSGLSKNVSILRTTFASYAFHHHWYHRLVRRCRALYSKEIKPVEKRESIDSGTNLFRVAKLWEWAVRVFEWTQMLISKWKYQPTVGLNGIQRHKESHDFTKWGLCLLISLCSMIMGPNGHLVINLNFCPALLLKDLLLSYWLIQSSLSLDLTLCSNGLVQLTVHGENSFHVLSDSLLTWLTNDFPLAFYHLILTLVLWGRQNTLTF